MHGVSVKTGSDQPIWDKTDLARGRTKGHEKTVADVAAVCVIVRRQIVVLLTLCVLRSAGVAW